MAFNMASLAQGLCSHVTIWNILRIAWLLVQGVMGREFCFYDEFQASCREGQFVVMDTAMYGRMHKGRCIQDDLGHIGCEVSVLHILDAKCSGLAECTIINLGALFKDLKPCPAGFLTYVDVTYTCMTAFVPTASRCQMSSAATFAPPPPGVLSNAVTGSTGCGSPHQPWVVEVSITQKINLTLLDFGTSRMSGSSCLIYGTIRDQEKENDIEICGGTQRHQSVYISQGNRVEISLLGPSELDGVHFMLEYKAVGCSEPQHSTDMWMKVSKDHVTIGCYTTKLTWKLTCKDKTWQGQVGNCTADIAPEVHPANQTWPVFITQSEGGLTFLVAIVAVVITVAVLIVALLYTNRPSPPAIALGSLDEPYEAKDIAFFVSDPRTEGQKDLIIRQESAPPQLDHTLVMPRQSCASVPVSTSDSDTYASENATLPLRAMDMDEFESSVQPPLPSKVRQTHKPPTGDLPPPELPPKYPPKVGSGYRANDMTSYSRLNAPNSVDMQQAYKSLIRDATNQSRPLPPVPLNQFQ